MKKFMALTMAICSVLSTSVVFASCKPLEHTCTFATEWSKDATHHWHACTAGNDCEKVADKAEHTWNAGEVTTAATATTKGVKTYTCTACAQTKTEEYEAVTTITAEEWATAMNPGAQTCEVSIEVSSTMEDEDMSYTVTYLVEYVFTPDIFYGNMKSTVTMGGQTQAEIDEMYMAKEGDKYFEYTFSDYNDDNSPIWEKEEVTKEYFDAAREVANFSEFLAFEDVAYDEATKSYKIANPDSEVMGDIENATIQFVDGRIVSFTYTPTYSEIPYAITIKYDNVRTLTLPQVEATPNRYTITAEQWEDAMSPGNKTCELTMYASQETEQFGMTVTQIMESVTVFTDTIIYARTEQTLIVDGELDSQEYREMYMAKEGDQYFEYLSTEVDEDNNPVWVKRQITEEDFNSAKENTAFYSWFSFEDLTYDLETKSYVVEELQVNEYQTIKDISVYFMDGKMVEFDYTITYEGTEAPYSIYVNYDEVPPLTLPTNATVAPNN
jgi:hypothetical protein